MDATVREIAARTQVDPENFKSCPNGCGATLQDDLELWEVTTPSVYYYCANCNDNGYLDAWKVNKSKGTAQPARIFEKAMLHG